MRVTFAVLITTLALSAGCPKSGTKPAGETPDKHMPLVQPSPDAGVPVVKKELPPYKPRYTRKKVRLYTSGRMPWFRARVKRPNLAPLPQKPASLPPTKLMSAPAAKIALKTADPKKPEYYRLKAILAYRAYQRMANLKKAFDRYSKWARNTKYRRMKYVWRRRMRTTRIQIRKALTAAAAGHKELANSAEAKKLYTELPRTLYHYALILREQRQWSAAIGLWEGIIKEHAKLPAAKLSHIALGDYYFRRSSFGSARRHYELAGTLKVAKDYWRALRHAWTLVKTRDARRGFAELTHMPKGRYVRGLSTAQLKLLQATIEEIAPWAYASYGKPAGAVHAFSRVNNRASMAMTKRLADIYATQHHRPQAIEIYKILLAKLPKDPDVCLWRFYSIAQKLIGQPTPKSIKALKDVVQMYKRASEARLLPSEGQRKCGSAVKSISQNMARRLHRSAREKPNAATWKAAEELYKLHLATFAPATRVRANYAEMMWRRAELEKDPRAAFQLWQATAQQFVLLSHRGAWRRLIDKAKKTAAQAWSNAAVIAEVGYLEKLDAKKLAVRFYKKSCRTGTPAAFTEGCKDHDRLTNAKLPPPPKPAPPPPKTPPNKP